MNRKQTVVLNAVGVGVAAVLGVGIASQVLLDYSLETTVTDAVQAGLVATLLSLGADYARRNVF